MEYVWVANSSELPSGQTKRVRVDGYEILLVNAEGAFYALACMSCENGVRKNVPLQMLVDGSELYVALPDPPD